MSEVPPEASIDLLLERLEAAIARLGDGRAPLEEVVKTYQEASRLMEVARARLDDLERRLAVT